MRMPSWETAPIMPLCSPLAGKIACWASGERAEYRRPEQEAGEQLPHDGRLPHSLHDLAHEAPDREQEDDLPKKDHLRGDPSSQLRPRGHGREERQRERRG